MPPQNKYKNVDNLTLVQKNQFPFNIVNKLKHAFVNMIFQHWIWNSNPTCTEKPQLKMYTGNYTHKA